MAKLLLFFIVASSLIFGAIYYNGDWECPYCHSHNYRIGSGVRTLMYYEPVYMDGANINPDLNHTEYFCECLDCGKEFFVRDDKPQEIIRR